MALYRRTRESRFPILAAYAVTAIAGCGSGETTEYSAPKAEPAVFFEAELCPSFISHLVIPENLHSGDAAYVFVRAISNPEEGDVEYGWRATSGTFSYPRRAITEYRCAERGPQRLTVTASDPAGCNTELELAVDCLD